MFHRRLSLWITIFCFAVSSALPGFAAILPSEGGTMTIVICSPDGLKSIEIAQDGDEDSDTAGHLECDVCYFSCSFGKIAHLNGWLFPQDGESIQATRPSDLKVTWRASSDQKLPRGPPV